MKESVDKTFNGLILLRSLALLLCFISYTDRVSNVFCFVFVHKPQLLVQRHPQPFENENCGAEIEIDAFHTI